MFCYFPLAPQLPPFVKPTGRFPGNFLNLPEHLWASFSTFHASDVRSKNDGGGGGSRWCCHRATEGGGPVVNWRLDLNTGEGWGGVCISCVLFPTMTTVNLTHTFIILFLNLNQTKPLLQHCRIMKMKKWKNVENSFLALFTRPSCFWGGIFCSKHENSWPLSLHPPGVNLEQPHVHTVHPPQDKKHGKSRW